MKVYLDASVLVAMLTVDTMNARADVFMRTNEPLVVISDFAAAEDTSAVSRRVRTREMSGEDANAIFSSMDEWITRKGGRRRMTSADVTRADALMRRLDLPLRTPDALHIAIAERVGATLATFDVKMAAAARVIGLPVAAA